MEAIRLYDHQQEAFEKAYEVAARKKCPIIQMPTGGGKTVIAANIMQRCEAKGNRAVFGCHRKELIHQASQTFNKYGIAHGYIAAGRKASSDRLAVASIPTLANRLDSIQAPHVMIWDECHHLGARTWGQIFKAMPNTIHIGFTATPRRTDGAPLGEYFHELVLGPQASWLMENGFLADYEYILPMDSIDRSQISIVRGDFDKNVTAQIMGHPDVTTGVVDGWKEHANGLKTIVFEGSVHNSIARAKAFNDAGISAAHIDAKTPEKERAELCRRFALGDITVLFNVGLFGEGFDVGAQCGLDVTVKCVVMNAFTMSLINFLQWSGRGLRASPTKSIIIDNVGNYQTHGLPCFDREWSLTTSAAKSKKVDEQIQTQITRCPACFKAHKMARVCKYCGHEHWKDTPPPPPQYKGNLETRKLGKIDKNQISINQRREAERKRQEVRACKTRKELIELGKSRGYKNPVGWAHKIFTERGLYVKKGRG